MVFSGKVVREEPAGHIDVACRIHHNIFGEVTARGEHLVENIINIVAGTEHKGLSGVGSLREECQFERHHQRHPNLVPCARRNVSSRWDRRRFEVKIAAHTNVADPGRHRAHHSLHLPINVSRCKHAVCTASSFEQRQLDAR